MTPTQYGNPAGAGSRVRRMDQENSYCVHTQGGSDWLMHYGVKGQKWGVITKEYEPVAVDHRRRRFMNPVAKARIRRQEKEAAREAKDAEMRSKRQEWLAKKERLIKIAGTTLAVGTLALAAYGGYKMSRVKFSGKRALNSLLEAVPQRGQRKAAIGRTFNKGLLALMAREQTSSSGLHKVRQTFEGARGILTSQRYRQRLKKARDMIGRYRNSRAG